MPIAHVALWTRDLETAASFWQSYFKADVGEAYYSRRRPGFISRLADLPGGGRVELMAGPWVEPREPVDHIGWDHVAIALGSTEAVDRLAERCLQDGILQSRPRMTGDGFYEAVIMTPDGTPVEITA